MNSAIMVSPILSKYFFLIYIFNHIHPWVTVTEATKLEGYFSIYPPHPLPKLKSPLRRQIRLAYSALRWRLSLGSRVKASKSFYPTWKGVVIGSQRKEINWIFNTAAMAES